MGLLAFTVSSILKYNGKIELIPNSLFFTLYFIMMALIVLVPLVGVFEKTNPESTGE
jgi:hypothetical protein